MTIVRQEIAALRKDIEKQESALREAREQLELHEKIAAVLEGGFTPAKSSRRPAARKRVNAAKSPAKKRPAKKKSARRRGWNAVPDGLPL